MIDVLRKPRPGFEDVINGHFRALRAPLLAQCQGWLKEASGQGALAQQTLAAELAELHKLLAAL